VAGCPVQASGGDSPAPHEGGHDRYPVTRRGLLQGVVKSGPEYANIGRGSECDAARRAGRILERGKHRRQGRGRRYPFGVGTKGLALDGGARRGVPHGRPRVKIAVGCIAAHRYPYAEPAQSAVSPEVAAFCWLGFPPKRAAVAGKERRLGYDGNAQAG
jgi:hypothetical protein